MASVGLATLQVLDGHVEPVARGDGVPLCREGPFPPSQEVLSAGAEFKSVTSFMKPPTGLLLGFHGKWRPATPAGGRSIAQSRDEDDGAAWSGGRLLQ